MLSFFLWLMPSWIMDMLAYGTFLGGIILILASWFVTFIPLLNRYRFPAQILGILLFGAGAFQLGGASVEASWLAKVKEVEAKVAMAEAKAAALTQSMNEEIARKVKEAQDHADEVMKDIQTQQASINKECKIPDNAIQLYNRAVEGRKPKK